MHAIVKRAQGLTFIAKADTNHWLVMDGGEDGGGSGAASSPKELLLISLGACSGFDVEEILRKRRLDVRSLEVELDADSAHEYPKVFTEVRITYRVVGDVPARDLERAIRLSHEKYCSVSAMLRQAVPIRWRAMVGDVEVASGTSGEPGPGGPAAE